MTWRDLVTLRRGLKLVSPLVGIITSVGKVPYLNYDPKIIGYGITACNTTCFGMQRYSGRSGGAGYSWEQAMLTTIGEVVERYCPAFYDLKKLKHGSFRELSKKAIHPDEFALFHDSQYQKENFPFIRFEENTELYWTEGWDITTGDIKLIPSSLIHMPWHVKEAPIGYPTSTGLAGHVDFYDAILTGLYEVIERDAFVITWLQELDMPKLYISPEISEYLYSIFPKHYEFHFFDITLDIPVPTIWGICFGEEEFGKFVSVGTATRSTFSSALKKVIKEIGQTIPYFRHFLKKRENWAFENFEDVKSFEDHSLLYTKQRDLLNVFNKWIMNEPSKEIEFHNDRKINSKEEIKRIAAIFDVKGYKLLVVNLTSSDIREAGFHCVKVISPPLIQLGGVYEYYFLGGKRIYEVPAILGKKVKIFEDLNKYPHPFP